jgi:hypothetical protein
MNTYRMAGQIEQAQVLLGCWDSSVRSYERSHCRPIDILSLSIGINDIGFQQILYSLTKSKTGLASVGMSSDEIAAAVLTGKWHQYDGDLSDAAGLESLRDQGGLLDQLAVQIRTRLQVGHALLLEYPDAVHHDVNGQSVICNKVLADRGAGQPVSGFLAWPTVDAYIDSTEAELMQGFFGHDLNAALADAAQRNGWIYVTGISRRFADGGHGYCASAPPEYAWTVSYGSVGDPILSTHTLGSRQVSWPSPDGMRWIRRWSDAAALQGPSSKRVNSSGTFHPNEWGHLAVCEEVVAALRDLYLMPQACSSSFSVPR